jgi:hypothetical protein
VLPFIVAASVPIIESAPWVSMRLEVIPNAPLPDSGRIRASGRTSPGIPTSEVSGESQPTIVASPPLCLSIPTAARMATRYGMIITAMPNPSLAPATKTS